MRTYLRQGMAALRVLLVLTVLTGVIYPFAVWATSRLPGLHENAEGSVVYDSAGNTVGSDLIGVDPVAADPQHDPWFHTRPSALSENALGPADTSTSGGSNLGASQQDLIDVIAERKTAIAEREDVDPDVIPPDAVTASASGLDPHISPAYAGLQIRRVARENGLSEQTIRALVAEHTTGRALGILGEPTVNVLRLNLAVKAAK